VFSPFLDEPEKDLERHGRLATAGMIEKNRPSLNSETLGLQFDEARALLQASQEAMVSGQVRGVST